MKWTPLEIESLRRGVRANLSFRVIAQQIGRDYDVVCRKARAMGLKQEYRTQFSGKVIEFIREKFEEGWSNREIAEAIGDITGPGVQHIRNRLGLRRETRHPRAIAKMRERLQRNAKHFREREGMAPNELVGVRNRIAAAARGWPPECSPLMCDVLDCLEVRPRTQRELCELLGRPYPWGLCVRRGNRMLKILPMLGRMDLVKRNGRRGYEMTYALIGARRKPTLELSTREAGHDTADRRCDFTNDDGLDADDVRWREMLMSSMRGGPGAGRAGNDSETARDALAA